MPISCEITFLPKKAGRNKLCLSVKSEEKKENPIYQECSVFVVINVEMALFKITFRKFLNPGLQTRGLKRNKNNNFIKSDFQILLDIISFSSKLSAQQICWLLLSLYKQPNIKPANASPYLKCSCKKKGWGGHHKLKKERSIDAKQTQTQNVQVCILPWKLPTPL